MKKQYSIEEVAALFPEEALLKNRDWAKKVLEIWNEAYQRSKWDDMTEAWYNPLAPGISLVTHTRACVLGALGLVNVLEQLFGEKCDRDVLVASCLLHDVCKIVEYEPTPDGAHKGSLGETYQHGFLSAFYAEREGFPEEVVSILISHTGESRKIPRSIEGLALYYADVADADFHRFLAGRELLLDKHK